MSDSSTPDDVPSPDSEGRRPPDDSVLLQLEQDGKPAPRVTLRDVDDPETARPGERPVASGRYQSVGEIARGGVGVILKCRDVDIGRDVAMKVLQEGHLDNEQLLERFVEEAQVGGQLQHPGIVPVYELGTTEDDRPYFTMKLVKGNTLAELLDKSTGSDDELRKTLGILEAVCMTVGYAHARGVIHRDLKPANVIVGSFGEVLVVDWGFAKVLVDGAKAAPEEAESRPRDLTTVVHTVRSGSEPGSGSGSVAGSVMGTPSYMPPEQALGDVDAIDARSDVFGLGALLCEILTGAPPYVAGDVHPLIQAGRAQLDDAFERLDQSGSDEALIALARRCLDPVPANRPADGSEVGQAIADHFQGIEEQARTARVDALQARVRADGERKRKRLVFGIAAAILICALGFLWVDSERGARVSLANRTVAGLLENANRLRGGEDWSGALAKVAQAHEASADADDDTRAQIARLEKDIASDRTAAEERAEAERKAHAFVHRLDDVRAWWGDGYDDAVRQATFAELLADLDVEAVRGHPNPDTIRLALSAWGERADLLAASDDDPLRAEIRGLDAEGLAAFFKSGPWKDAAPETLLLLAGRLEAAGRAEKIVDLHRAVLAQDDTQFFSKVALAWWLTKTPEPHVAEAIGYLMAAATQRPESPAVRYRLARTLAARGDHASALRQWRALFPVDPDHADVRTRYLVALLGKLLLPLEWSGHQIDSRAALAEEIARVDPKSPSVLRLLGDRHAYDGDFARARPYYEASLEVRPEFGSAHSRLARLDLWEGDYDAAEAHARVARKVALERWGPAVTVEGMGPDPLTDLQLAERATGSLNVSADFMVGKGPLEQVLRLRLASDPDGALAQLDALPAEFEEAMQGNLFGALMGDALGMTQRPLVAQRRVSYLVDVGRLDEARRAAEAATAELSEFEEATGVPMAQRTATDGLSWELAQELGDFDRLFELLDTLDAAPAATAFAKAQRQAWRGVLFGRLGRKDEARAVWVRALEQVETLLPDAPDEKLPQWAGNMGNWYRLAPASVREVWTDRVLAAIERGSQAGQRLVRKYEGQPGMESQTPASARFSWIRGRAQTLAAAGRHEEALTLFAEVRPMRTPLIVNVEALSWYALSLARTGRISEARSAAERVLHWHSLQPWTTRNPWTWLHIERARRVLDELER